MASKVARRLLIGAGTGAVVSLYAWAVIRANQPQVREQAIGVPYEIADMYGDWYTDIDRVVNGKRVPARLRYEYRSTQFEIPYVTIKDSGNGYALVDDCTIDWGETGFTFQFPDTKSVSTIYDIQKTVEHLHNPLKKVPGGYIERFVVEGPNRIALVDDDGVFTDLIKKGKGS